MAAESHAPAQFELLPSEGLAADRLLRWIPTDWRVAPDWQPLVARFWESEPARRLGAFMESRLAAGAVIYPPDPLRALALTPLAQVRVVILGQDPYHGRGQAEGLAFSVASGVRLPPSLRNIFKELSLEAAVQAPLTSPRPIPADGSLVRWASQGVLLLNTCLTVEEGCPASHANRGWEALTDMILRAVMEKGEPVVFMLWGGHAQGWAALIEGMADPGRSLILRANHPSPLSALRPPAPFMGCHHFALANDFLQCQGAQPVCW